MENNKVYIHSCRLGIDDLKSIYPYNDEWGHFFGHFNVSEEEYIKDPEKYRDKITKWNEDYIEFLKRDNRYGNEITREVKLVYNPIYDDNKISKEGLSSYKFVVLDFTNE